MILKLYFKFLFFLDIYKDIVFVSLCVCVWGGGGVIFKIRIFSLAWLNNTTTLV